MLERTEANKLLALEVLLGEAVLDQLAVELLHAADEVVLKPEIGQEPAEPVEVDAVVPRIGANLAGVDDLGGGDQPLDLVADVADLVVLPVAADVDGLVVDDLLGRPAKAAKARAMSRQWINGRQGEPSDWMRISP